MKCYGYLLIRFYAALEILFIILDIVLKYKYILCYFGQC